MIRYGVDRFEGDICVLIDMDGGVSEVEKSLLPEGVKEGDVIYLDGGYYWLEPDRTEAMREVARQLIDELFDYTSE